MMKFYKSLLTCGVALASVSAAWAAGVPYSSHLVDGTSKSVDSNWTIVDNNADKKTWAYAASDAHTDTDCLKYTYGSGEADDWAISPGFELTAGTEYSISYFLKEYKAIGSGTEILKVYVADSNDIAALKEGLLVTYEKNMGNVYQFRKQTFTPEQTGTYYVAFQACSPKNQWYIYLRDFTIKENVLTPSSVTDLQVVAGENKALKATLSWTLPVTDEDGNVLEDGLSAVKVRRNGELIATLPGDATSYVDNEIPEGGIYVYSVVADINGVESTSVNVTTSWIGPKVAQALPYTEDFTDEDRFNNLWGFVDVDEDCVATKLSNPVPPYKFGWCMHVQLGSNRWPVIYAPAGAGSDFNDWMISAPLKFPGAGKYKVAFKISRYSTGAEDCLLDICLGNGDTPDALANVIGTIEKITSTELNPKSGELKEYEVEVSEKGTYYIGFHALTPATAKERRIHIGAFSVELVELYDAPEVLEVPFDSATAEDWQPVSELSFSLLPGYYHASYDTTGDVEFEAENAEANFNFHDEFVVVKATEECVSNFSTSSLFSSFSIVAADHTPADAQDVVYAVKDGLLTFEWTNPSTNRLGERLYEIVGAKILDGEEICGELAECEPGARNSLSIPYSSAANLRANSEATESAYSLVLHNLSGESRVSINKDIISAILSVEGDEAESVIYSLDGRVITTSAPERGVYIRISNGKTEKLVF